MIPAMQPKPILYCIVNNHFDLTWRRCWQRPFTSHGQSFVSYVDLETYYLLDNIALAQQDTGYKFEAESVQVVRKFLVRYPEHLATLQQLGREGRFAVTGSGEAIVDANMILGESLVRNYVDGLLWVEKNFGRKTRLALRNDAFGNSAQLPQILRGCEIAWATGMSYSPAQGLLLARPGRQRHPAPIFTHCRSCRRRLEIPALPGLRRNRKAGRRRLPHLRRARDPSCAEILPPRPH